MNNEQTDSESILPESFDRRQFLAEYWQKKPLLIRAGALSFLDPVTPEELAGLACEPGVESRLIQVNESQTKWSMRQGPFDDEDFLSLPQSNYSLLVQAVDQWVDGVSAMLGDFDFVPGWRVDDIMVSYATDQGNVGPHFDYYDVFLIQGMGQKRWQLGQRCDALTPIDQSSGLRLLKDFKAVDEYTVSPGDILYIPPGLAHYGVAVGPSITYSVGFRAPSWSEILSGVVDQALDDLNEDQRYTDPQPSLPRHYGEIPVEVISDLQQKLTTLLTQPERIRQWFGQTMTAPRYPLEPDGDDDSAAITIDALRHQLEQGMEIYKVPGARFAYYAGKDAGNARSIEFFADGVSYSCNENCLLLLQTLSAPGYLMPLPESIKNHAFSDDSTLQLLADLYNQGSLTLD
ncbi:cupin domain-containing protein [Pseudohongiella sp. SYSU M77423]|uniref:cupin domain-containing protein n=1 Tax=Pseudohongiella sp. SYSU M77423 TaxID=3042312 RepID=UPI00248132F2|nr:cupin domain-containing protein [Pseudohongiella sp. SYSU M77423]MDH7943086.1 cupin domain-containing protein [Pseudohongiella sp. SYSU M77423]